MTSGIPLRLGKRPQQGPEGCAGAARYNAGNAEKATSGEPNYRNSVDRSELLWSTLANKSEAGAVVGRTSHRLLCSALPRWLLASPELCPRARRQSGQGGIQQERQSAPPRSDEQFSRCQAGCHCRASSSVTAESEVCHRDATRFHLDSSRALMFRILASWAAQ